MVLALALVVGCNRTRLALDTTADIMERAAPSFAMESDVELAKLAAPGQLKQLEGLLYIDPTNRRFLLAAARGYCDYTFAFLEDEIEVHELAGRYDEADRVTGRAKLLYQRCMRYGLRWLGAGWEKDYAANDLDALKARIAKAGKAQVPGIFYAARGLASSISMARDDLELVVKLPLARLMFERVLALDERYMHGAGHVALALMDTALGEALGGDPESGRKHFERAIELTGGRMLMTKVVFAKNYARMVGDRDLFVRLLSEVLEAPADVWPEMRLPNELARIRARRYLDLEEEWF